MTRKFNIPSFYRSPIISTVKLARRVQDARKKDLSPSVLDVGPVRFKIARHFGFCFGVENAIEIAFKALAENPGKRVFLLSEMIHNPSVNADLRARGVQFLQTTDGQQILPFETVSPDDVVIVPAFGTTVELFGKLESLGINPHTYNATCPFVEKVWNRSEQLGKAGHTIIIHGKHYHEETRATFSHAQQSAPSLVIRNMSEAEMVADFILDRRPLEAFATTFSGRYSAGFDPAVHLTRIGVVNQTTMLAGETQQIAEYLRSVMIARYGEGEIRTHFADTKDTLCYATSENQEAIHHLVTSGGDLAIVVGGYKSSNSCHLAKLCAARLPTFYIEGAAEIVSLDEIHHLDPTTMELRNTTGWLPKLDRPLEILVSAGASSPDAVVDAVLVRIAEIVGAADRLSLALRDYEEIARPAA